MKRYHIQSTTRILVLAIVAVTLIGTQIPAWRSLATQLFLCEICLLLVFILSSLISWKKYW